MKRICCIYSRNKLDFKKYTKSSSYDEVINYNDITSKLIKNDINSVKPSTIIINSYIRKKLQKALESKSIDSILYVLKTLDEGIVSSIKELISEFYKSKYELNLIILNKNKIKIEITDSFKNNFDDIEYINV
jgi:hypothetical protein